MSNPKSFTLIGQSGRKYRVYFNPQRGHWYAAYKDGEKRIRQTLNATTKPEATVRVQELDGPKPVQAQENQAKRWQWAEFTALFVKHKLEQGVAQGTARGYVNMYRAVGRYLDQQQVRYLDEITLQIMEGYPAYRMKTEECDTSTTYVEAMSFKHAMKWASKASRGILAKNPGLDWELKKPVKPKRKMYSAEEVATLENNACAWLKPIVTTLAWTGLRIGELIALRWQDVDLKQKVLHIRVREDWRPKGKRDRIVPLHPKVEAVLKQRSLGEYVFTESNGKQIVKSTALRVLQKEQGKLGLEKGDLHGFRRFFATTMLQAGVNINTVRQWGGWRNVETLMRYLADSSVEDSVKAMEAASKRLASA
jgi:integrase/recombinase XerD